MSLFYIILTIICAAVCAAVIYGDVDSSGKNKRFAPRVFERTRFFRLPDGSCDTVKLTAVLCGVFAFLAACVPLLMWTGVGDAAFLPFALYAAIRLPRVLRNYEINREYSGKQ